MTKCKKHPRYAVKRAPRSKCRACRVLWRAKKAIEYVPAIAIVYSVGYA